MILISLVIATVLAIAVHPLFFMLVILLLLYRNSQFGKSTIYTSSIKGDPKLIEFMYTKNRYLKSEEWKRKRTQVLFRDRYTCQKCGTHENLQVHHISYSALGNEPLHHLTTLCNKCHTALHEHYGYPQTYKDYMNANYTIPR